MNLHGDEAIGRDIIRRALEEPIRQIVGNAGLEGSVVVNKVKEEKTNFGYDVTKDQVVDMIQSGVIDPAKVTRTALQNAASIASLLLTTEAMVSEIPEDKPAEPPMPGRGGMGGMPGMY